MMLTNLEELLTPAEIAIQLRVSRQTVYNWIKANKLLSKKAGHGWRITPDDINSFLRSKTA